VQFTDPTNSDTVMLVSQNYTGGDVYPFGLSVSTKDAGKLVTEVLNMTLNSKTNVAAGTVTVKDDSVNVTVKFTMTPSNDSVQVTAPANTMPLTTLLNQLGLGSYL
jgi:hypothetical protein